MNLIVTGDNYLFACLIYRIYQSMQTGVERATDIFSSLCKQSEPRDKGHKSELILLECILGNLFVRGYRLFRKETQSLMMVFFKRVSGRTHYLYLKVLESNASISEQQFRQIEEQMKLIDEMKGQPQNNYVVLICFLQQKTSVELNEEQYQLVRQRQEVKHFTGTVEYLCVPRVEEELLLVSKDEFGKLKEIIVNYVDTFGSKYKTNLYCDLERRSPTSYDIRILINTVSWIIYTQTLNQPYSQVESANWTCFQMKAKEKLSSDRKDIVFTGSSRILMVAILFMENLQEYVKATEKEAGEVLLDCRNSYLEGSVKAYKIHDFLHPSRIIYQTESTIVKQFSTLE